MYAFAWTVPSVLPVAMGRNKVYSFDVGITWCLDTTSREGSFTEYMYMILDLSLEVLIRLKFCDITHVEAE